MYFFPSSFYCKLLVDASFSPFLLYPIHIYIRRNVFMIHKTSILIKEIKMKIDMRRGKKTKKRRKTSTRSP